MLRERRTQVLLALLVLLAGSLAWMWWPTGANGPATAASPAAGRRPTGDAADALPAAADVRLEALTTKREGPDEVRRNPFRFGRREAPPSAKGADAAPPVFTMKPAEPAEPAGPPPPPPITVKFIGRVERADGTVLAVLAPADGRMPVHGAVGDIIDGRYRILKIGVESIEMAYLDGRGRQTIRLSGQ